MSIVHLVQTMPPDMPGSMAVYADMIAVGLAAQAASDIQLRTLPFYDPAGGASMWRHHVWRMRHARRLFRAAADAYYHVLDGSMSGFVPRACLERTLVTVHDLIPVRQLHGLLPGKPSRPAAWVIRRALRAVGTCRGVCADSACTAADVEHYAPRNRKPAVIPLAPRALADAGDEPPGGLPGSFILHIGNNAPYKNRRGVVEVFARLRDRPDLHLVMVGPAPTPDLAALGERTGNVHFLANIGDSQLSRCYRRARLLLFPSLYEGFGLPVVEAMLCGCPVVCSNGGSLPEVAGGAALAAEASDIDSLAAHCRALLDDPELRAAKVEQGRAHAATFTPELLGQRMLAWYRLCIASG